MVWFILAGILLYVCLFFAYWNNEYFSMESYDIKEAARQALIVWSAVVAVSLLVLFVVLGVISFLPMPEI